MGFFDGPDRLAIPAVAAVSDSRDIARAVTIDAVRQIFRLKTVDLIVPGVASLQVLDPVVSLDFVDVIYMVRAVVIMPGPHQSML